ncbi:IS66 family insertion sequence element accessory protein TnpB [Alicyclobacillus acidoterrestris]|nr:IS66 family insertion sequence element accessory protein TnpB [Alicyclobacillus suci]
MLNEGHAEQKVYLEWDTAGFWLHYRRLEKGRFQWPEKAVGETVTIHRRELRWVELVDYDK